MPLLRLTTEAKKIIPIEYDAAHTWLDDLLTTYQCMHDPVSAIRFFMLGLYSGRIITLDAWDGFDSMIAYRQSSSIH